MNQRTPLTLVEKYNNYTRHNNEFHIKAIAELWGIEPSQLLSLIINDSVSGCFVDGLWIRGYTQPMWYYEVCDTVYSRGGLLEHQFHDVYIKTNKKIDQHISVFKHDRTWFEEVKQNGTVGKAKGSVSADVIYIELDRKNADIPVYKAWLDAQVIVSKLPKKSYRLIYSGNNSIHIHISASLFGTPTGKSYDVTGYGRLFYNIAHSVAGDVRYSNGIVDSWREHYEIIKNEYILQFGEEPKTPQHARQELENIDPNIYKTNSLIRQPFSIHPKTEKLCGQVSNVLPDGTIEYCDYTQLDSFPPLYLEQTFENYERKPKYSGVKLNIPNEIIRDTYNKLFNFDFNNEEPNDDGWVPNLFNPFYEDLNPSVCINILDGRFYDFGNPDYQFDFVKLYAKVNNISLNEAKEKLW